MYVSFLDLSTETFPNPKGCCNRVEKGKKDEENESKKRERGGRKETHICPSRSHNSHGCDYVQLPREAASKIDERRLMEEEEDAGGTKGRAVSCERRERERERRSKGGYLRGARVAMP